jgi:radical SAM protein with 4Fe4S-binding SPASM domain
VGINFGLVIQINEEDLITTNDILGSGTTSEQFLKEDNRLMFDEADIEPLNGSLSKADAIATRLDVKHNIALIKGYLGNPEAIASGRYLSPLMEMGGATFAYPFKRTLVDTYGNVYPCSPIRHKVGDLKEKTLQEIWLGESYSDFRNEFMQLGYFPVCLSCCNLNRQGVKRE